MATLDTLPPATRHAYRWDSRSGLLSGIFQGMTLPFFAVIARRMDASDLQLSLLISAPFLGHLLSIVVAWHMQSRPKKPYALWLGIAARTPLLLMAVTTGAPLFIGIVIASQLIGCFVSPAYAAIMKDAYPDDYRGRLMGLVRVGMTAAAMVAGLTTGRLLDHGLPWWWVLALAAGLAAYLWCALRARQREIAVYTALGLGVLAIPLLADQLSYRVIFPAGAVIGILAWWAFDRLPEAPVHAAPASRFNVLDGLLTLVRDRRFGLYSLAFFTFGFGNLLQNPLIPMLQVDELHISDQWVGILAMTTAGVSAVFYAVWGRVLDRFNPFLTATLSFAIWGFTPFVYAAAHSVPTLLVASILIGIAQPGIDLTWLNAVMQFADRDNIPRYASLHTFLVGIRGLLAPIIGVWMLHALRHNLRLCFLLSAVVIWLGTLLMGLVAWFIIRPTLAARAAKVSTG